MKESIDLKVKSEWIDKCLQVHCWDLKAMRCLYHIIDEYIQPNLRVTSFGTSSGSLEAQHIHVERLQANCESINSYSILPLPVQYPCRLWGNIECKGIRNVEARASGETSHSAVIDNAFKSTPRSTV